VKTAGTSGKTAETFAEIGKTCGTISDPVPAQEKLRRTGAIFAKTGAIFVKITAIYDTTGRTVDRTDRIFVTTWPAAEVTDSNLSRKAKAGRTSVPAGFLLRFNLVTPALPLHAFLIELDHIGPSGDRR
jgi:hypothetical protein